MVKLARTIDWGILEENSRGYADGAGQPPLRRAYGGAAILQHTYNFSDEGVRAVA